jgi:hypothetical protein
MNPENASNATASATTSNNAPNRASGENVRTPSPDRPVVTLTEAEFLEQQSAAARKAITDAFDDLKVDLAKGTDPRVWMKSHPWITLASAAVAGFAAAAAVVPSKEQEALSKLQRIERALNPGRHAQENGNGSGDGAKTHRNLISMLLHEAFGVIKPAIISLIASQFSGQSARHDSEPPAKQA